MKNFSPLGLVRGAVMLSALALFVLTAPGARLDYGVAPGLDGCPDEAWIRAAVSARLGRDPFSSQGGTRVRVRITGERAPALVGQLELTREDGRVGRRTVDSPSGDCMELASALELAVSLALDPLMRAPAAISEPPNAPAPVPVAAPAPVASAPVPIAAQASSSLRGHVRVGPLLTAGALPGFGAGLLLGAGLRLPKLRVTLEGRVHAPGGLLVGETRVGTFLALGSVVPCLELGRFAGCAVGSLGALRFQFDAQVQTSVMAQAGLRVELRFEPLSGVFLTPFLEGTAVLTRTSVYLDGALLWVTWPASISGGVVIELQIPS